MKTIFFLLASVACLGQAAYTGIHGVTSVSNPSVGPLNLSGLAAHAMVHVCYVASTSSFPGDIEAGSTTRLDNLGNTYNCTTRNEDGDVRTASCSVIGPSVSSSMTFTAPNGFWQSMTVAVYVGITSGPDQTASSESAVGSGSVTPTNNDELVVSCMGDSGVGAPGSPSSPPSFTGIDLYQRAGASAEGVGNSYQIQTTATTVNPAWGGVSGANAGVTQSLFSISAPAPLTVTATTLPEGFVSVTYSKQLQASGGVQPYTWTVASGTLPAGLTLSAGGLISGTPTGAVSATPLGFLVTDSNSSTGPLPATGTTPLTIASAALSITSSATAATGTQYASYPGYTVTATGGTQGAGYVFSFNNSNISAGAGLPEGMVLNSGTGAVSSSAIGGQGTYKVQMIVTDSLGATATQLVTFALAGSTAFLANIFPSNSIFRTPIDLADCSTCIVDTSPAAAFIPGYLTEKLKIQFGSGPGGAGFTPNGHPVFEVPYNQALVGVTNTTYQCYFGVGPGCPTSPTTAPIPGNQPVEDSTACGTACDSHTATYLESGGGNPAALYEMYQGVPTGRPATAWTETSNALWSNVGTNAMILNGTTDAAGLPIAPLLYYPEEVIGSGTPTSPNGSITNACRMDLGQTINYYVWPATTNFTGVGHCTATGGGTIPVNSQLSQSSPPASCVGPGPSTNAGSPMGELYRIKASDSGPSCLATSPMSTIIFAGMKKFGCYIADNGAIGGIDGTPDTRWVDTDLACLGNIALSEWEPVNVSNIQISNNSLQAGTSSGTAPAITSACPTSPATQGQTYSFTVTATGSPTPTFGVLSGTLPSGLTLNTASGVISGTPLGGGTSSFTLEAVNGVSPAATQACSMTVVPVSPTIGAAGGFSAAGVIQ